MGEKSVEAAKSEPKVASTLLLPSDSQVVAPSLRNRLGHER